MTDILDPETQAANAVSGYDFHAAPAVATTGKYDQRVAALKDATDTFGRDDEVLCDTIIIPAKVTFSNGNVRENIEASKRQIQSAARNSDRSAAFREIVEDRGDGYASIEYYLIPKRERQPMSEETLAKRAERRQAKAAEKASAEEQRAAAPHADGTVKK